MLLKKRKREEPDINGSSMADIAFLLLIFFLVTTTINVDTGIGLVLPPPLEDDQEPPPIKERNLILNLLKPPIWLSFLLKLNGKLHIKFM